MPKKIQHSSYYIYYYNVCPPLSLRHYVATGRGNNKNSALLFSLLNDIIFAIKYLHNVRKRFYRFYAEREMS